MYTLSFGGVIIIYKKGMEMMSIGTLLQFQFKNFRSFADETILDMMATNIKENNDTLIEKNQLKILPIAAVFGANASGKSNLFSSFSAMRRKVIERNGEIPNKTNTNTFVVPFLFSKSKTTDPTEFEVCINIENKEYRYGFICNKSSIIAEWMYTKPFRKSTKSEQKMVFERNGRTISFGDLTQSQLSELKYCDSMILDNQLLLNAIGVRKKVIFSKVYYWFYMSSVVNCSTDDDVEDELEFMSELLYDDTPYLKNEILQQILEIDPSIKDIKIKKTKDNDLNDTYKLVSIHEQDGKDIEVSFDIESSGTRKALALYFNISMILSIGAPLFVDELDAKLHPLLLRKIIQMFSDRTINHGNGQLIFSSHNLVCLDSSDLRRDEIWFVEKTKQKSSLFSLYDFKDYNENSVRADLSFGKHYLAGRFGAIPFQQGG